MRGGSSSSSGSHSDGAQSGYRHEALLYAGHDDFIAGTMPFIRRAIATDEPVLVVLGRRSSPRSAASWGDDLRLFGKDCLSDDGGAFPTRMGTNQAGARRAPWQPAIRSVAPRR
jgi:hypothetical protein